MPNQVISIFIDKSKLESLASIIDSLGIPKVKPTSEHELFRFSADGKYAIIYKTGSVVLRGIDPSVLIFSLYPESPGSVRIGCDEAGKGEPTGSIFCACVALSAANENELRALGVRDSKELSDEQITWLAKKISAIADVVKVIKITPETISKAKHMGFSINRLLTKSYSRLLSSVVSVLSAKSISSDKISMIIDDYNSVECSILAEKFKNVVFFPRAEKYIPVAAASIIARAAYLQEKEKKAKPWA